MRSTTQSGQGSNAEQPATPAAPLLPEAALAELLRVATIEGSMSSSLPHERRAALRRQLAVAIRVAGEEHAGQFDAGGQPYVLHPFSVALRVAENPPEASRRIEGWVTRAMIVAVLHDVLEDSDLRPAGLLAEGIDADLVQHVASLTRREGEPYFGYIDRIASSGDIPRAVKIADLQENLRPDRRHERFDELRPRYERALARLGGPRPSQI